MVTDIVLYLISIVICIQCRQWMGSELCFPAVNVSDNWRLARKLLLALQNPVHKGRNSVSNLLVLNINMYVAAKLVKAFLESGWLCTHF